MEADKLEKENQKVCMHPFASLTFTYVGMTKTGFSNTYAMAVDCSLCNLRMQSSLTQYFDP